MQLHNPLFTANDEKYRYDHNLTVLHASRKIRKARQLYSKKKIIFKYEVNPFFLFYQHVNDNYVRHFVVLHTHAEPSRGGRSGAYKSSS